MDTDNTLVTVEKYTLDVPDLPDYSDRIRYLVEASVASKTQRAYTLCLKRFVNWCNDKGLSSTCPIAPEILAMYITDMIGDGLSNATITQTMAAISTTHKVQGLNSPTESLLGKLVLKRVRREYGTAHKKHDAATVEIVRYLLNSIPDDNSPKNVRDKAIIALGFAGAFRRSELCAIDVERLTDERLTPQSVRLIVKQTAAKAVLSLDLTVHSLRSGDCTMKCVRGKSTGGKRNERRQTGETQTQQRNARCYARRG